MRVRDGGEGLCQEDEPHKGGNNTAVLISETTTLGLGSDSQESKPQDHRNSDLARCPHVKFGDERQWEAKYHDIQSDARAGLRQPK